MTDKVEKQNEKKASELVDQLNRLIETCRDGEKGYHQAAQGVENPELVELFENYSRQRGRFVAELEAEVRRLGGDPEKSGSVTGAMHRGWLGIKAAATGKDEGAVISECERGEDVAVKHYREALEAPLPPALQTVVQHQYTLVKDAHDHIRLLEKART